MKKIIGLLALLLLAPMAHVLAGSNVMKLHSVSAAPGETVRVELEIINDDPFVIFGLDIPLPDGFTLTGTFELREERENGHSVSARMQPGHVLRVLSYSLTNATFNGNSGVIGHFHLIAPDTPGDYLLNLQNAEIVGTNFRNILTGTEPGTVSLLESHRLTLDTEGEGSIHVDGEPYTAPIEALHGTVFALEARPAEGWHLDRWQGDAGGSHTNLEVVLDADKDITAVFSINTYNLLYRAEAQGRIEGEAEQTVAHGADGSPVEAVADDGYHFIAWSDESTDNPRTDTNVTDHLVVTATFAINTYTITATAGDNGAIDPSGEITVTHGEDQAFAITPDDTYRVDFIKVDGDDINLGTDGGWDAAASVYTFRNIQQSHSVEAGFTPKTYTITFSVQNAAGDPITDAAITFDGTDHDAGVYVFADLLPDNYNYTVKKSGYFDLTGSVEILAEDVTETVTLQVDDTFVPVTGPALELEVFPNPTGGQLHLAANHLLTRIELYDLTGRLVYTARPDALQTTLDLGGLGSGTYLLHIHTESGLATRKIQLQR